MNKPNIAIIDYRMSNLFSIRNALDMLGINSTITSDPKIISKSDGAILPGVGSYPGAIENLHSLDLFEAIKSFISSGKPFLGICLGLQLLFERSEEFQTTEGLGIIQGSTKEFKNISSVKTIPHVGWNQININTKEYSTSKDPFKNIQNGEYFYFVHSLYVHPENNEVIKTSTNHDGFTFCSSIMHENIFASQFHPEKSGKRGLLILDNFFK